MRVVSQTDGMVIRVGISSLRGSLVGVGLHAAKWVGLPVQRVPTKARQAESSIADGADAERFGPESVAFVAFVALMSSGKVSIFKSSPPATVLTWSESHNLHRSASQRWDRTSLR